GPSRSNIPLAGRRTQGILADRGGPRAKSKKDGADEVDEQVVAGKQFRRQGGAWVDTSYSPRATINVARGSEQFRALIADEPGLRAITNQLGGEVIVVWKGKAYRFR
ncbi:MAG TPA: hypothetical protein VGW36_02520, partial [Pyrinomonadaceae bacterium]|nr:hypothetical protein [Pyrinomonadaceae bacterium]